MSTPTPDLAYNLRQTFKDVVKTHKHIIAKLQAFADEFDMTVDVVNNRLYGRVDIDDYFLKTAFNWLAENTPQYAARFLRHYFNCNAIQLSSEDPPKPIDADDLHELILRIAKTIGDVAGEHVASMTDGQLDLFEIDAELRLVEIGLDHLAQYQATLLHAQADVISQQHDKKTNRERRLRSSNRGDNGNE